MVKNFPIKPPFFEVGPKALMYGERMLKLAKHLDKISAKYGVQIILTPQPSDIYPIAKATDNLLVFAQHMDPLPVGRGLGSILPEAVKAAGAVGVMLNHAEKPLTYSTLKSTIERADEVGLCTIVCTDSMVEAKSVALLEPNIIVAEPTELIGTGIAVGDDYAKEAVRVIAQINPAIEVLIGAGISTGDDVYRVIKAGAPATGCTSGILKNSDPEAMAEEMIAAVRRAWDER